jgi:hypothetical protein
MCSLWLFHLQTWGGELILEMMIIERNKQKRQSRNSVLKIFPFDDNEFPPSGFDDFLDVFIRDGIRFVGPDASSGFKQFDKAFDLHIVSSQTYFGDG